MSERVEVNMAAVDAAVVALREQVAGLPAFPADGVCPHCDGGEWRVVEPGYWRWTRTTFEDGVLSANGWDDMSEEGAAEWIECDRYSSVSTGCGAAFQAPESLWWS